MTNRFRAVAAAGALLLPPLSASAQTPTRQAPAAVVLSPTASPRWDLAGHVSYFSLNKSGIAVDWNDWSDTAAAGVSGGYYWNRHVKLEMDLFASAGGDVYSEHVVTLPTQGQFWFQRRHVFQTAGLGTGLRYQLFDNRWVHPFAGGGVEAVRQRETIESSDVRLPPPGTVLPAPGTTVTWMAHPYLETGAKFYVSENAFIRTDVRAAFDRRGVAAATWRTGIGVDF